MGLLLFVVTVFVGLVLLHFWRRARKRARNQGDGSGDSLSTYGGVYSFDSSHSCHTSESGADSGNGGSDCGGGGGGGD